MNAAVHSRVLGAIYLVIAVVLLGSGAFVVYQGYTYGQEAVLFILFPGAFLLAGGSPFLAASIGLLLNRKWGGALAAMMALLLLGAAIGETRFWVAVLLEDAVPLSVTQIAASFTVSAVLLAAYSIFIAWLQHQPVRPKPTGPGWFERVWTTVPWTKTRPELRVLVRTVGVMFIVIAALFARDAMLTLTALDAGLPPGFGASIAANMMRTVVPSVLALLAGVGLLLEVRLGVIVALSAAVLLVILSPVGLIVAAVTGWLAYREFRTAEPARAG